MFFSFLSIISLMVSKINSCGLLATIRLNESILETNFLFSSKYSLNFSLELNCSAALAKLSFL